MESQYKQAYKKIQNKSLSLKIKEHEAISTSNFLFFVATSLKLNDELMCLTYSLILIVKQCREFMQNG